ncbi:hypothetical protein [Chryseosolibacter indicus]|uniref:Uncharacterized protein n=1 Tax=Chryseosolibacter indicus TaxID=2782351 RepID=A0ABS5VYE7_9BACT|nr:hypothetical protein [Chryseosolibacter indicus]MBT1706326.1 hypothetical protein [Chryseosolibacter indicus]
MSNFKFTFEFKKRMLTSADADTLYVQAGRLNETLAPDRVSIKAPEALRNEIRFTLDEMSRYYKVKKL